MNTSIDYIDSPQILKTSFIKKEDSYRLKDAEPSFPRLARTIHQIKLKFS